MIQPQATNAGFTHGLCAKWTFIMGTIPEIENELQSLENAIRYSFLPSLTRRQAFSDMEQEFLTYQLGMGALEFLIQQRMPTANSVPSLRSVLNHWLHSSNSRTVTILCKPRSSRSKLKQQSTQATKRQSVKGPTPQAPTGCNRTSEKGTSAWLTTSPIAEYDFNPHKQAFRDAVCV